MELLFSIIQIGLSIGLILLVLMHSGKDAGLSGAFGVGTGAGPLGGGSLVERYRENAPPANFRAIDSPLVSWIWIGGAIMILGALIAIWPSPEARMRRVTSIYAAKLGKELSQA